MVRSIVGTLVDVGLGKALARRRARHPRRPRPGGRRPGRPALRPRPVGGRLPAAADVGSRADDDESWHGRDQGPPDPPRSARRARRHRGPPAGRRPQRRTHPHRRGRRRAPAAGGVHRRRAGRRRARRPRVDGLPHARPCSRRSAPCATSTSRTARPSTRARPSDELRHLVCEVCGRHLAVPRDVFDSARRRLERRLRLPARRLALRHRRALPHLRPGRRSSESGSRWADQERQTCQSRLAAERDLRAIRSRLVMRTSRI